MNKKILLILNLILFFSSCQSIKIDEAQKISTKELIQYCKKHNYKYENYYGPKIAFENNELWSFHYEYKKHPKHFINILVYSSGSSEIHFMPNAD